MYALNIQDLAFVSGGNSDWGDDYTWLGSGYEGAFSSDYAVSTGGDFCSDVGQATNWAVSSYVTYRCNRQTNNTTPARCEIAGQIAGEAAGRTAEAICRGMTSGGDISSELGGIPDIPVHTL